MSADGSASPRPGPEPDVPAWAAQLPRQARPFQGHRAGIVTRVLANVLDVGVTLVVLGLLYLGWAAVLFVVSPASFSFPDVSFLLVLAAGALVMWVSFTVSWATTGRTTGARIMGVRVVNYRGERMRWGGAALRAAFCLGFLPGLFWAVVSSENRSLQDTVLRTSVIYDWTSRSPAPTGS
jgi:uncharacterized RDD family membrane protein YckC